MKIAAFLLLLAEHRPLHEDFATSIARAREIMRDFGIEPHVQDLILAVDAEGQPLDVARATDELEALIKEQLRANAPASPQSSEIAALFTICRPPR